MKRLRLAFLDLWALWCRLLYHVGLRAFPFSGPEIDGVLIGAFQYVRDERLDFDEAGQPISVGETRVIRSKADRAYAMTAMIESRHVAELLLKNEGYLTAPIAPLAYFVTRRAERLVGLGLLKAFSSPKDDATHKDRPGMWTLGEDGFELLLKCGGGDE